MITKNAMPPKGGFCLTNDIQCDTLIRKEVMRLSNVFGFRLPDDLRQYLERRAKEHRCSVGHYIVMLILKDKEKEKHEHYHNED